MRLEWRNPWAQGSKVKTVEVYTCNVLLKEEIFHIWNWSLKLWHSFTCKENHDSVKISEH